MARFYQKLSDDKPALIERLIGALCYLSMGLIGLLYILVSGKHGSTHFFRFHFIQSIVLGALSFLLSFASGISTNIMGGVLELLHLPFGVDILLWVSRFWYFTGYIISILIIYSVIFALLGKYAEIPGVSRLVKSNMGRY